MVGVQDFGTRHLCVLTEVIFSSSHALRSEPWIESGHLPPAGQILTESEPGDAA